MTPVADKGRPDGGLCAQPLSLRLRKGRHRGTRCRMEEPREPDAA